MSFLKIPLDLLKKIAYALYELYKLIKEAKNAKKTDEQK